MTPPIVNNGIYKYIFSNLKYIDKSKYEFSFLTQAKTDLEATEEYQKYGFKIHNFTTTQRENPEKFYQEIKDILSKDYDVLHLHTSFWRGFLIEEIAMEIGIPKVIVHSHSTNIDIMNEQKRNKMYEEHLKFKDKFNVSCATDFWACSQMAASWLFGEQIPKEKIRIMKNAIELEQYLYNEDYRCKYRKLLNLDGKFVIGNTCRFEYQKNHEFLIRVFALIYQKMSNAVLVLTAGGQNLSQIKKMVKEYGIEDRVIFLGWRNDIPMLLQAMDLYCLPSRFEGLSIAMIEAQAAGLPCIASLEISQETKVTEDVMFIEFDEEKWCKEILKVAEGYQRKNTIHLMQEAGYDIKKQIKIIEKEYSEC